MKFTLSLNSHQLSDFQRCECNYMYSHLLQLEPLADKPAFKKGSLIGRWLNLYYYNVSRQKLSVKRVLANPLLWTRRFSVALNISESEAFYLYRVLTQYAQYYKGETWIPRGVEVGFSKVLFEDSDNLFIYEGRVDLMVDLTQRPLGQPPDQIVDHKTQSQNYSIYEFNNQVIGYLWATGAHTFVYNYLTLTKEPKFHRAAYEFRPDQIEDWRLRTVKWFHRLRECLEKKEFLESLQCETKFGRCNFSTICEQPREAVKLHVIHSNYKIKKPYRSW